MSERLMLAELGASVQEQIESLCVNQGDRVYLLVDGARLIRTAVSTRPSLDARQGTSLLGIDADHPAHAVGPLLFDLNLDSWKMPSRSRRLAELVQSQVCSIVITKSLSEALVEHLRKHLDVSLSDGESMLMRFFDPRVLPYWFEVLPAGHRSELAQTVRAWAAADHGQQLNWLPLKEDPAAEGKTTYPLSINRQQEDTLMRQCLPYTLLDKLLVDPDSLLAEVPGEQRYARLSALIGKAQTHGFDGMADMEEFCRLGLRYGANFDERPPMARALRQKVPQQHVHELLAQFSESDWKGMTS